MAEHGSLRGWAPRGRRLTAKVPHRRWKTTTFLAALRHDRIAAPWLLDGPIDGESFGAYVEKVLVPKLREGDIVIMSAVTTPGCLREFCVKSGLSVFLTAACGRSPEAPRAGTRQNLVGAVAAHDLDGSSSSSWLQPIGSRPRVVGGHRRFVGGIVRRAALDVEVSPNANRDDAGVDVVLAL
jgi:hypothetical protein